MAVFRWFWLLLLVASACSARRLHHPQHGTQQMLLIDLPEQREVDSSAATELSTPAEQETVAGDETKTEGEDREAEQAVEQAAVETEPTVEVDEVEEAAEEAAEPAEEKAEQRPPRIVKRQCYGCAEVVCSCPDCGRR